MLFTHEWHCAHLHNMSGQSSYKLKNAGNENLKPWFVLELSVNNL